MKIAFISPYDEMALGIRSMSSFLRDRGHEVSRILIGVMNEIWRWTEISAAPDAAEVGPRGFFAHPCRFTTRQTDLLLGKLTELDVEMVGISLSSNLTGFGEWLTRRIREELGVAVIWGGIDPTLHPEEASKVADFVCVGEGEYAVAELAEALENGGRTPEIDGIWTRRPDGSVYHGAMRPLIQELDALPFNDWGEANEFSIIGDSLRPGFVPPECNRVHVEAPLMTQRGCPFQCSYCCYSLLKKRYPRQKFVRRRSVDHVMGELHSLARRFPDREMFFFHDDVFTVHPEWIDAFADRYPREFTTPFGAFTHPTSCTPRTLEPLKRAGMSLAVMGIQSGSERMLRECYNRPTARDSILRSTRLTRELGIDLAVDLIAFNPLETEEDSRATFELLLELPRPFRITEVNALSFYDGLPVTEMALREGVNLQRTPDSGRKWVQEITSGMRFWAALMGLTMFDLDPDKVLRPMSEDPYLREHPEILENLRLALYPLTFLDGQTAEKRKDRVIADMQGQLAWWHQRAHRPLWRRIADRLLRR